MILVVHYNKYAIEVSSTAGGVEDGDSWGQLAQRFVERSLMHPPQLLPLLTSLSSLANNHSTGPIKSKNSDGVRYLFRFGDGYATMIQVIWGNTSHNDGNGDCGGEMIEANISFKPRAGNKLQHQCHPSAKVPTPDSIEGSSSLHVDLIVEVVGFAGEQQRNGGKKSKGGSSGGITTFPMTQTPFPIDDTKQNLLCLREHPKFKGVVDHYTLERWNGASGDSAAAAAVAGGTLPTNNVESKSTSSKASHATSNTEVTQMTHSTAAILETDNLPKKNKREKRKKSASTEQETDSNNIVDSTPQEKNGPPPKPHRNGFMMFNAEVRPRILAQHPNLLVTELAKKVGEEYRALTEERRQKYIDDARLAILKYKEEHPEVELNASTKSKKKTKEDANKKSSVMPPTPKPLPPLPPLPDSDDDTSDEEDSEEKRDTGNKNNSVGLDNGGNEQKNKPKRPLNAYLLYSNEVRNQVRAANPDATAAEIMCKIAEAYQALDDGTKQWYKSASESARAKYKEEYGEDAMKLGPRSKGKVDKKEKKKQADNKEREKQASAKSGGSDVDDSTVETHGKIDFASEFPENPANGLPTGWMIRVAPRPNKPSQKDKYWYSPVQSYKFPSIPQVKRFLEMLKETDGDEKKAYKLLNKRKSVDATDNTDDSKKAKKKKKKTKKVAVEKTTDENEDGSESEVDDGMPDAWGC